MLAIPGEMFRWFGFVKSQVSPLEEKENQIWNATCGSFLRRMPRPWLFPKDLKHVLFTDACRFTS